MGAWDDFLKRHGYNADGTVNDEKSEWEKFCERHNYDPNQQEKTTAAQGKPAQPTAVLPGIVKPSQRRTGVLTENTDGGKNAVRVVPEAPKTEAPTAERPKTEYEARMEGRLYEQTHQTDAKYYTDKIDYALSKGAYQSAIDWMEKMTRAPLTDESRQAAQEYINTIYENKEQWGPSAKTDADKAVDKILYAYDRGADIFANLMTSEEGQALAKTVEKGYGVKYDTAAMKDPTDYIKALQGGSDAGAFWTFVNGKKGYLAQNAYTDFEQRAFSEMERAGKSPTTSAQMDSYIRAQTAYTLLDKLYNYLDVGGNTPVNFDDATAQYIVRNLKTMGVDLSGATEATYREAITKAMQEQSEKTRIMGNVLRQEGFNIDAVREYTQYQWNMTYEQARQKSADQWAKNAGFGDQLAATMGSWAEHTWLSGYSTLGTYARLLGYAKNDDDPNKAVPMAGTVSNADLVQSSISNNMSETGAFLYGVGNSMIESFLRNASSGAFNPMLARIGFEKVPKGLIQTLSLSQMGVSVAGTTANQILQRGGNSTQAIVGGLASGAIEAITEVASLEVLLDKVAHAKTFKGWLVGIGLDALAEGSEEGASNILNYVVDAANMGNLSESSQAIQRLLDEGKTLEEAQAIVLNENIISLLTDVGAGALSGGGEGMIAGGVNFAKTKITDAYYNRTDKNGNYKHLLFFSEVQQKDKAEAAKAMYNYSFRYLNGNEEYLQDLYGMSKEEAQKAALDYARIQREYRQITGEVYGEEDDEADADEAREPAQEQNTAADIGIDRRIFTEDTAAEDARSVVEAHRQMERDGTLQNRAAAEELLKTAETATVHVQNAEATGRLTAQQAYDSELALRQVIESAKAVLEQNNTPAQTTAPVQNIEIGGMDNGRTEGITDGAQRNEGMGADQQNQAVQRSTEKGPERGRNASIEVRRALNAGEYDQTSAKSLGIEGGSEKETMQILRDSVVDRIDELRQVRDEAAKDGVKVAFFAGALGVYNKYEKKTNSVDGLYNPSSNTVYVKADKVGRGPAQLYSHEMMHKMMHDNPGMLDYALQMLGEQYTPEELDRLVDRYCEAYHGIYGTISESMTADERDAVYMKYVEEICADAYAGLRRGGINTTKAEQAMAPFRSERTDGGKETAAATARTNGPGENNTAGTEDGGEARYSAEDGTQAVDEEEYKKPITVNDIQLLRSIIAAHNGKRVSINDFTSEDIQKASKWAYKFFQQMGTKSPFFRAWFGEWRANDSTPYSAVKSSGQTYRGAGNAFNEDTQRKISWGDTFKSETRNHAVKDRISLYALGDAEQIVKNAILFDTVVSVKDSNSKMENTAFMHSMYSVYEKDGNLYLLKLFVEEALPNNGGDSFARAYQLKDIEKIADLPNGVLSEDGGLTDDKSTTFINNIAGLYSFVKQYDGDFTTAKEVNSALLNEDGTPKMFYHGAKNGGGFDVFKNWQYFTEQEQYAQRYAKRDDPSAMYAVYLTADKVFDTRNADAAEVFDSIRQEYGLSELQDTGLPDWTDGYDITDYLSEHPELGYDAVLLDEGGDLVDGKPVSRGTSIVIKDPTQVKSATDNIGTYDRGNENYRYSVEDDAAEYDEDYRRAVQRDAAEDEPTEKGITVRNGKETVDPDYAAEGFARIRKNAQEASLQQLRQMIKKTEEDLRVFNHLKREGRLTDADVEKMKTVKETLRIQQEELKNKNAEERKQREKRKEEEAKQQQPRIAKKELKAKLAESFHVTPGQRAITNDLIEQAANKILQRGYLDAEDKRSLFNALLRSGVVNIAPEGYYGEIRSYVQQGRIYVPESVREEFGDDWADFSKRAWGNRIYLTSDTSDRGIDDWNADLAQMFPGGFEEGATDMKEALEQIVRLAEEGSAENITIAEMMERNKDNYGWTVESQMEGLEDQLDAALKRFAETAGVEIRVRQEKATEVLKERRRMREMIERESARKRESEQRNLVVKLIRQLNRMRKRSAPEVKAQIDEVLNGIDTVARSISDRGLEDLIDLAKAYEQAKADNPNFIPNPYVEARLARLQQTQLDDMEIGDVIELGRVVSALVHSVQEANRLHSEEYKAEIDATARSFVEEMKATKGSKGGKLYQWAVENHLSPVRMIRHLGGWAEGGASAQIAQSLENGQTRQMRYLMEASHIFDRFLASKENKAWLEKASGKNAEWIKVSVPVNYDVNENDQTEIEWQDVEITPMMRVALYMHSLNFDNLRHIEGGGMTIPNRAYYEKGDMQNAYAYGTRVKMTPETVRAIVKDMTEHERAFAGLLREYYDRYSKDRINEVSMILDGFERAGGENYYHIKTDQNFLSKLPDNIQKNISLESIGSIVNERVFSKVPIVLEDASVSLADHIQQISKYYGFAVPIHDFTAIMNFTDHETGNIFSGSVRELMGQQWGAGAQKYLNKLMEDLQISSGINEMTATFLRNLRGKLAGASLMFNPAVALSQFASYPGALQTLGPRALAEGLRLWERTDMDLINRYSPLLWYRNQGNSTQELGDYMEGQTLEHKLPWLLGWIQKVDSFTVRRLWAAAEYYVSNNTDLKPGSEAEIAAGTDEYYQKVAEMFNRAIYDTQPNYSTMQRAQILRSNSDLTKFLTMFKTVPVQYYNMMFEAAGRLSNAKRRGNAAEIKSAAGYFARTTIGLVAANAFYVAMKSLFKWFKFRDKKYRDEEGNWDWGEYFKQFGLDVADTFAGGLIGGAELLEAVENIVGAVKGDKQRYNGVDINALAFVTSIVQDVIDLGSAIGELDGKDLASALKNIVKDGVMGTLGLPAENVETYLLALTKWISPETAERYENLFSDRTKSSLSEENGRYLAAAISVYMDNRTEDLTDEVKQELQRLWEAGQKNAIPSAVPSSVTIGGESIALTSAQKAQFREDWSGIVSENLEALIGTEYYQNADETTQGKLIDRLYRYASEVAKANLGIDYTAENWAASADTDGLPEYLTYYTLRSMLDRDGDETQNTAAVAAVMDYVIGGISEDDAAEIARLYMGGAEGLIPQTAPASFTYKDENGVEHAAELDAKARAKYAETYRNAIGDQLTALMSSPEYADADDKGRAALIGKVFDFAAGVAKAEAAEGYTPDKWILNGFEDMADGIQLADYIVYNSEYTHINGKNEDGDTESGLKDRRTFDLIDSNDWTDDQKISVYLDTCSTAAAGKVQAMDAAGFSWRQIKTVMLDDKPEYAVLEANISDNAKLKVLGEFCNATKMIRYQTGKMFGVSFKDYAEVVQKADTNGSGSISQDEATAYIKNMGLYPQQAAYLWQMVTDGKNGKNNPFSPTFGAEFYYEMHKND